VADQTEDLPGEASDLSPEGRRRRLRTLRGRVEQQVLRKAGPGTRAFAMAKRVLAGVYNDGFVHAGNFAYMALLSLFPFFIAATAIVSIIGEQGQREALIDAILLALPQTVRSAIGPVARDVVAAREGWLLWVGGAVGLWTASSLVETIRDMLHRVYGTVPTKAFWKYRLDSIGLIFTSVFLLLLALGAQVAVTAVQQFVYAFFPRLDGLLNGLLVTRLVSAAVLFGATLMLFGTLTPSRYRKREFPKWPGALFVAAWWTVLIVSLPFVLRSFFSYDLTYGSLAGVMVTLFFFWLVGFGVVIGASLNAALAVVPGEAAAEDDAAASLANE
jgi:membrane protein